MTAFRFQHTRNPIRLLTSRADINEGADDIADHMLQKGIGLNTNADHHPLTPNVQALNRSHRRGSLTLGRPKTRKVMLAEQMTGTGSHPIHVERTKDPSRCGFQNRRTNRIIVNPVFISPRTRGKTGMKIRGHDPSPMDRYAGRQQAVEPPHPVSFRPIRRRIKTHHLLRGMHPGIRPTGADRRRVHTQETLQRQFESGLDRRTVRLNLPAVKIRPPIFNP
ncbi:hypothetical protein EVA_06962 [gut metagenome]|uniref:Uncharacterized protein n=1 Tax=gut metagenome TaxID=749906 RepID=J9GWC4_9ZZZZ